MIPNQDVVVVAATLTEAMAPAANVCPDDWLDGECGVSSCETEPLSGQYAQ